MASRSDNVSDAALAAELLLARRGQAFWARALNDLPDAEFDAPSLRVGYTRRHVIAHVGFHARALARLVEGARTGKKQSMYTSAADRDEEIAFGATLPHDALRNLAAHAAVHLNVEWRDLPGDRWSTPVLLPDGAWVVVSETVRMRAREVWRHAIDLDNGATFSDIPVEMVPLLAGTVGGKSSPWCPDLGEHASASTS